MERLLTDTGKETIRGFILDAKSKTTADSGCVLCHVQIFGKDYYYGPTTDFEGNFRFPHIKPGFYRLEVHTLGYNPFIMDSIELHPGEMINMKIELQHKRNFIPPENKIEY